MKILFHTVLDSEEFRNGSMAGEFLRRGHEVVVITHSRLHEMVLKKCSFLQGRVENIQPRVLQIVDKISSGQALDILEELLPGFDIPNAMEDDILFSDLDSRLAARHAAALASVMSEILKSPLVPFDMLYSETGYLYRHIGSMCAQAAGVVFLPIESSRVNGRFVLLESGQGNWLGLPQAWKGVQSNEIVNPFKSTEALIDPAELEIETERYLSDFHEAGMPKGTDVMLGRPVFRTRALTTAANYLFRDFLVERGAFPYCWWFPITRRAVIRRLRCLVCSFMGNDVYWKNFDLCHETFVFYPMPVPWETTVRHRAPKFADNLSVIRGMAANLPDGIRLYVKEHPINLGGTPLAELKAMAELPNVRLLPPETDSRLLISRAFRTITLNGTAGLETILMGRRPITLANCFYDIFGFCDRAESFSHLGDILSRESMGPFPGKDDVAKIVKAMIIASWKGEMDYSAPSKYPLFGNHKNLAVLADVYEYVMKYFDERPTEGQLEAQTEGQLEAQNEKLTEKPEFYRVASYNLKQTKQFDDSRRVK
ncbi:MAG: hypothetical protein CVV64_16520 [Candidatus Wallbacteria bacterium HGW-Wallbacteria-1]|jgi:hypothetical protein|uniref:Capsule polysaccharide biosynthesis protein n=1 Tax=Candidatus Wallbacteria bacterium HGW-Wallbacteria-1 TaxID=2013854 RepID=A0A2N1PKT8_9BACT|nr:MAG: hypothetical protein CVV64_16520 [Candidatus Wallbacteria bacterium HGW-Wallbacteria-1]